MLQSWTERLFRLAHLFFASHSRLLLGSCLCSRVGLRAAITGHLRVYRISKAYPVLKARSCACSALARQQPATAGSGSQGGQPCQGSSSSPGAECDRGRRGD